MLRNIVLTAAVAMSGAVIAGTSCLGRHRASATTTVTSSDETQAASVSSTATAAPTGATTITSTTYNITNDNRTAGSGGSGVADTARQEAPVGAAPAAVQVRGAPVVVSPMTGTPTQVQVPAVSAPPAGGVQGQQQPLIVPVPGANGIGTPGPTPTNNTVPAVPVPQALTPGYGQVQQGGPPAIGVPQTTATAQPVAPPATGTPPPVPTAATPQTGLGTGFSQTTPAPR